MPFTLWRQKAPWNASWDIRHTHVSGNSKQAATEIYFEQTHVTYERTILPLHHSANMPISVMRSLHLIQGTKNINIWLAKSAGDTISGRNGYASKLALVRLCGTIVNTDFVRQRPCVRPSHFRTVNHVKARSQHPYAARLSLTDESFGCGLYTRWSGGRRKQTHNTEVWANRRLF